MISLVFINAFFYRLAEHGTDRSAMILIMVTIIELLYLINNEEGENNNSFLKFPILITLIVSLKTFYALYALLFIPIIFTFIKKKISLIFFFKSVVVYSCLILLCLVLTVNFFNSGCLLYPIKNLCFENFSWAIPLSEVEQMNLWYQQWAKAGANPHYRVENPEIYIKHFNWVSNWFNEYFFNKVSDFLLGLLTLSLFVFLLFFSKKIQEFKKPKYLLIYIILIFLILQWFYLLPTLRYGGYHLIAMIFFIPLSIYLSRYFTDSKILKKKVYLLILLAAFIFLSRNISRLYEEYNVYNYNVFNNAYYNNNMQNFSIFENIQNLNKCHIEKDSNACTDSHIEVKFLNNSYIYYRVKK